MLLLTLFPLVFSLAAWAQNFTIPSTWTNTSTFFSFEEIQLLARNAIIRFKDRIPRGTMTKAVAAANVSAIFDGLRMLSILSREDRYAYYGSYYDGYSDNRDYVSEELKSLIANDTLLLNTQIPSHSIYHLWYAMACLDVYVSYHDDFYLTKAQSLWDGLKQYQIVESDIAAGTLQGLAFQPVCGGESVVGAFWKLSPSTTENVLVTESTETMMFLSLSARLAEYSTYNGQVPANLSSPYLEAAQLAIGFWEHVLTRPPAQEGCLRTVVALRPDSTGSCVLPETQSESVDCSTIFGEGLAIFSSITGNATIQQMMMKQLTAFMHSPLFPLDGILTENTTWGTSGFYNQSSISSKYDFMRSIGEIWKYSNQTLSRSKTTLPEFMGFIAHFANAQINALMGHATTTGSDLYGSNWLGPPADNFTIDGMSAAISALTAAIGTTSEPVYNVSSSRPLSAGAIVSISLACGAVLIFITVATVRIFRRRLQDSILSLRLAPKPLYALRMASATVQDPETRVVTIGEKQTALFWRNEIPVSLSTVLDIRPTQLNTPTSRRPASLPDFSARPRKQRRERRVMSVIAEERSAGAPTQMPGHGPMSTVYPDVQQLLRRANSLNAPPGTPAADLRQRLAELGPIPEVLQALQDLLRSENAADPELPRYEEGRQ